MQTRKKKGKMTVKSLVQKKKKKMVFKSDF